MSDDETFDGSFGEPAVGTRVCEAGDVDVGRSLVYENVEDAREVATVEDDAGSGGEDLTAVALTEDEGMFVDHRLHGVGRSDGEKKA